MRNDKKISKTVQAIRQLADDFLTMEETPESKAFHSS